jgi:CubicO group peptidase (beta-lactamase class C family)
MIRRLSVAALVVFVISARADAPLDAVKGRMQSFIDSGEIAGAVTVIGRAGGVLSYEAVGFQDLESRTPMAKESLFRIASMTKPITSLAIMMLVEQHKVQLDDPVAKYLPEFLGQQMVAEKTNSSVTLKKPYRPVTVRDLLTHTSGLAREFPPGLADLYTKRNHTLAEGVLVFSQRPLEFEPGSRWVYCNPGIDTLGRIVEVVSAQPFEEFLHKRIFEPLGMKDTTFYPTAEQLSRLATTYDRKDGKLVANPFGFIGSPVGAKYCVPSAGLFSTGADLAKLYRMLLNKGTLDGVRILDASCVAEMTRLQTGDLECGFVPGMGFGLGCGVVKEPQGVTERLSKGSFGHGGAFGTQGWMDPNKDFFAVLLIQRLGLPNADASPMRRELQALAADAIGK